MAQDNTIPHGSPGVAAFETESWGNKPDPLYGDTPPLAVVTIAATADGALDLPIYSVISFDGTDILLATHAGDPAASNAAYVTAAPIVLADNESMDIPVYAAGHFDMDALNWDSSFDTDAKKKTAFEGSISPTILVSKKQFSSDGIPQ